MKIDWKILASKRIQTEQMSRATWAASGKKSGRVEKHRRYSQREQILEFSFAPRSSPDLYAYPTVAVTWNSPFTFHLKSYFESRRPFGRAIHIRRDTISPLCMTIWRLFWGLAGRCLRQLRMLGTLSATRCDASRRDARLPDAALGTKRRARCRNGRSVYSRCRVVSPPPRRHK